jgi:hypothetical protein
MWEKTMNISYVEWCIIKSSMIESRYRLLHVCKCVTLFHEHDHLTPEEITLTQFNAYTVPALN